MTTLKDQVLKKLRDRRVAAVALVVGLSLLSIFHVCNMAAGDWFQVGEVLFALLIFL